MKSIYTTTVRLNLNDEDERRAWEYLRRLDKQKYRSFSKAVVTAVNDYFGRQERLADDPYLETREKEDAFLQRIADTIERNLQTPAPMGVLSGLLPLMQSKQTEATAPADDEAMDAALDFVDSF